MAILTMQWFSQSLGKCTKTNIYVNDRAKPPYPTYYLLHGLSDDETKWMRGTQFEDHADRWPFLIVMPDAERSFYCDYPAGAFETLVAKELVERIDALFPTRREAKYRAVGGLSMGGYGAFKFALKYPGTFRVGVSHSGALAFARDDRYGMRDDDFSALFSEAIADPDNNLFELASKLKKRERPALAFDCGRDDFLLGDNRAFRRHLRRLAFPHVYHEGPGGHTWDYWNAQLPTALAFAAKTMRLKAVG